MSGSSQAVFLSYASQDADAAGRISQALRAAGIEVWFDQSELRGGDAWDTSIRRQIKECALFVPIVSANTEGRKEGYFRREWHLAVDRMLDMSDDEAFLLPVVIDATEDAHARVPARFKEVQWTRLPDGRPSPEFVDRVRLLAGSPGNAPPHHPSSRRDASSTSSIRNAERPKRRIVVALSVAALLLGFATMFVYLGRTQSVAPKGSPAQSPVGSASLVTPAASVGLPPPDSIAVMPFVDMSEKKDQQYFSDGLAEELLDLLSRVPELHVAARTSAFSFKGKSDDIPTIAKKLLVANVLEGSVRKSGNNLRITVQLIRADNGYHVWSKTYDRKVDDIFKIQDDIAQSVVQALKISLLPDSKATIKGTQNVQAYTLFLQAREVMARAVTVDSKRIGMGYLKRAAIADPEYADPWAGLSYAYSVSVNSSDPPDWDAAREAAAKALSLDPNLPKAHCAMARVLFLHDWDWDRGQAHIEKALAVDPGNALALAWAGDFAMTMGHRERGLEILRRSVARDPANPYRYTDLGSALIGVGNLDEALANYRKEIELGESPHVEVGTVLLLKGEPDRAMEEFNLAKEEDNRLYGRALALYALHQTPESDLALADLKKKYHEQDSLAIATIHAYRGEADQALDWLDRALRLRDPELFFGLTYNPLWAAIRPEPRYQRLLKKLRLPG